MSDQNTRATTERLLGTTAAGNQYATCVPKGISDEGRRSIEAVVDAAARKLRGDLPEPAPEVVMDANGAYWRRYPDHLSMPPVSDDNEPVTELVAVYRFVGWEQPLPPHTTYNEED